MTPEGFLISFRFSQWKAALYGARIAETAGELERLLVPIAEAGPDLFHASTRRHWEPAFDGYSRTLAGWARHLTGVPSIAVGSVGNDPSYVRAGEADSAVHDKRISTDIARSVELFGVGEFDLLTVGRALLANYDWVHRARVAHEDPVRPFSHALAESVLY